MTTYLVMQTRISDELARDDLSSQVQLAILSAIDHYERERFYFTEGTATFSTVAGQEYYSSSDLADIATLVEIDSLRITVNSTRYTLCRRDFAYIDEIAASSTTTGDPTDFCYYKQQIRLYPTPSSVRTITMAYIKRLTALSSSSDSNAWTTDAEEMIRMRAKADLLYNVIRDPEEAAICERGAKIAHDALCHETARRISAGRVRPTNF